MASGPPGLAVATRRRDAANGGNGSPSAPLVHTVDGAEEAVVALLSRLGEDPDRNGLRETPKRVVAALLAMTKGYTVDVGAILGTTFEDPYEEPVTMRDITFWSLCEHHLLPFHGKATVAYVPNGRIVGLSKIARTVEAFANRLQVQERLTRQIADAIASHLGARGVAVHVEATHLCMAMRGVRSSATTVTRAFLGTMAEDDARREFLRDIATGGPTA